MKRKYRLRKREDFRNIYRHGKSTANRQFVVYYMQCPDIEHFQLGVSVNKKLGKAVVRNRLRRWVKEIVRNQSEQIIPHVQFIIIVRHAALSLDFTQFKKSLNHALRKAKLLT